MTNKATPLPLILAEEQQENSTSFTAPALPTLTIAVLTKNEARRIRGCLQSAAFADQLIVVDSGSTDGTRELAEAEGAEVFNYPDWQGFGAQRNRLLAHAKSEYVFFLDADEVITAELQAALQAAVHSGARAVWKIRWLQVAFKRELTYFQSQATLERLFRRDMLKEYVGIVHEQAILTNEPTPRVLLQGKLLHYSRETVRGSLEKLLQYSMLGAAKRAAKGKRGGILRGAASGLALFVRLYIVQLGFLCGGPGFLHCFFVALEGFFRYVAIKYDYDSLSSDVAR